jgi:hypothetical protein
MLLLAAFAGCRHAPGTPSQPPPVVVRTAVPVTAARSPFVHLADDMSADCIKSASDPHVGRSVVYLRCVGAKNALLNVRAPQPYADDNAVTASILEIYAAYALRDTASQTEQYHVMLRDAGKRLRVLSRNASSEQTRARAVAARLCLVERDAGCLKEWARFQ